MLAYWGCGSGRVLMDSTGALCRMFWTCSRDFRMSSLVLRLSPDCYSSDSSFFLLRTTTISLAPVSLDFWII